MSKNHNKIRRFFSPKGMSLSETLLCVLILTLVTSILAAGVQLANNHYHKSVSTSEAKILCSTLKSVITNELGNTNAVVLGDEAGTHTYVLDKFFSRTYAIQKEYSKIYSVSVDSGQNIKQSTDGYGEIFLGTKSGGEYIGNLLISSAAYSSYKLEAKIDVVFNTEINVFSVDISIKGKYNAFVKESFDVIPLNEIKVV